MGVDYTPRPCRAPGASSESTAVAWCGDSVCCCRCASIVVEQIPRPMRRPMRRPNAGSEWPFHEGWRQQRALPQVWRTALKSTNKAP